MKIYNYYLFLLGLSFMLLSSISFAQTQSSTVPTATLNKNTTESSKIENEDLNSFENSSSVTIEEEEEESTDEDEESQTKQLLLSIPKWKYYTGATVGSLIGFGLGHLIQDRYVLDNAWKYSVTESALLGGMILAYNSVDEGFNVLKGSSDRSIKTSTKNKVLSSMFGLLGVGLLSCKLFEITALWSDPKLNTKTQNYDIYTSYDTYTPVRPSYSWDVKLTGISPDLKLAPGVFFNANF